MPDATVAAAMIHLQPLFKQIIPALDGTLPMLMAASYLGGCASYFRQTPWPGASTESISRTVATMPELYTVPLMRGLLLAATGSLFPFRFS